jgi:CBS domain containing-hemolysin-like protein
VAQPPFTARSLALIIRLLLPLVWFSQLVTKSLKKEDVGSAFTRKDFLAMADIGARHGVFEERESAILNSLLQFRTVRERDVMTPRTVVKAASACQTVGEFFEHNRKLRFSRIPLYEDGSHDHVIGYMLKHQLLDRAAHGETAVELRTLKRDIIAVSEDHPIIELFTQLLTTREHIALVVGRFGGMAGIVTMEDVIETLLGVEIVDESDQTTDMQVLARRNWERRARRAGWIVENASADEAGPGAQPRESD